MKLRDHAAQCRRMSTILRMQVFNYFGLPLVVKNVADVLDHEGYYQADLVLCLLRINSKEALHLVARLVGHPILVCPPCLLHARRKPPARKLSRHELKITWVASEEKLNTCGGELAVRLRVLRPGMLLEQYRARGGRRRDLRLAARRGLVRLERAA